MANSDCRIIQLSQHVVDKIAAGEVVVRPVNAVKELIENSLDAGSTEISVSISGGGLELIKIQDNGNGFAREDLPIACCRFTTSKLKAYEDLRKIKTYGFRGEALASISIISTVTITTRKAEDKCAYKAVYKDGQMVGEISQSAGLPGTIICAEKLFHNMPSRLASFKQPHEEANRIADLLIRYAIHYPNVAFAYHRLDGKGYDFRTSGNGDQHATIRALLHEKATKEFINLEFHDPQLHFSTKACMCTPAAVFTSRAVQARHDKLKVFHLFINGRSVDSPRLQRSFDAVFTSKDALCPFVSLSLEIEPERVDVNVHPTKSIVHFLDEDRIIERIEQEIHNLLTECRTRDNTGIRMNLNDDHLTMNLNDSFARGQLHNAQRKRKATGQQQQQTLFSPKFITKGIVAHGPSASSSTTKSPKVAPKNKIRVDFSNRSLDEFLLNKDDVDNPMRPTSQVHFLPLRDVTSEEFILNSGQGNADNPINLEDGMEEPMDVVHIDVAGTSKATSSVSHQNKCTPRDFDFHSLVELRKEICKDVDNELLGVFRRHLLIGFYDTTRALIQSADKVYLVRNDHVLREFFYQYIIFSFGNMGAYDLVQSENARDFLPIRQLLQLYLEDEMPKESAKWENKMEQICQVLIQHRNMLWDYFSLKVLSTPQKEGTPCAPVLAAIPCLIDGFMPELEGLPRLLYQLGHVDYKNERNCYAGIAAALAEFHVPFMGEEGESIEGQSEDERAERDLQRRRAQRALRAVIFPALRNRFLPGRKLQEYVQMLTSTAQAFKHFGRC